MTRYMAAPEAVAAAALTCLADCRVEGDSEEVKALPVAPDDTCLTTGINSVESPGAAVEAFLPGKSVSLNEESPTLASLPASGSPVSRLPGKQLKVTIDKIRTIKKVNDGFGSILCLPFCLRILISLI